MRKGRPESILLIREIFKHARHCTATPHLLQRLPSTHRPTYRKLLLVLVEARREQGLVQTDLAERLGKPPSFVAKTELGDRRLDVAEFIDYANALGIDPVKLLRQLLNSLK
jgi:ribosome-binding protein aMBF1 (putative translation factor)